MNIEVAVLNVLSASPRALPVGVIRGELPAYLDEDHTLGDIEAALKRLERKGHVAGTRHEDRGTLWTATADGRLRIAA